MWKSNFVLFSKFLTRLKKLDRSRGLLVISCLLLAVLYPGQNYLQTLILHPGPVRTYSLPKSDLSLYAKNDGTAAPPTSARAVIVQDAVSKSLLYSKAPDTNLMPASTTKIMTALVALDTWSDLDTAITVQNEDHAIGSSMNLKKGETITIRNLLYGLLVHSGNDTALALADNYPGGYPAFVAAMNQKAKSLHLDHTTFKNPSGVEQYGHATTARDLAVLASYALQTPLINQIVQTKKITVTDTTGTIVHPLETTNQLLGQIEGLKGLKTGWTENAGECLVSYVERGDHKIIVVVLGSLDRFGDTTAIIDWAYAHHQWITPQI